MNKKLVLIAVFAIAIIAGCKKTDNAANWVGTYNQTSALDSFISRVAISEVNSTTLQIQLQAGYAGAYSTFATIQQAKLNGSTAVTVNETGNIAGNSALYQFSGSGTLAGGNTLTLSGYATNTTNAADVKPYYFVGNK